jgi:hypothetical protein
MFIAAADRQTSFRRGATLSRFGAASFDLEAKKVLPTIASPAYTAVTAGRHGSLRLAFARYCASFARFSAVRIVRARSVIKR